jgi:hypothetical protein
VEDVLVLAWSVTIASITMIAGLLAFGDLPALAAIPARVLFFAAALASAFTAFAALIGRVRPRAY